MKKLLIALILMISFQAFSQQPEYSFKRDYYDSDKINIVDSRGNSIGYYKTDFYDKEKVNIFSANGAAVGYFKADYYDKDKVNVYSTGNNFVGTTEKAKPLEIPQLTGLFDNVQYTPPADAIDNNIRTIQAIKNARNGTNQLEENHKNMRQEDYHDAKLEAEIKNSQERLDYVTDSIIRSRPEYFNTPKAIVPVKLIVDGKEYFITTDFKFRCDFTRIDEKGRMWCYDYNHNVTGFWEKNPVRGSDFYQLKK